MKKAILLSALISFAVIPGASAKTIIRERVINSPDYVITPAPNYVVRERPAYVDGYYQKVPPHHRHYHRRHGYDWDYWHNERR